MLLRRFATMFRLGQFDNPIMGFTPIDFQRNGQAARIMAEQGSVLLKNANGVLPLNASSVRSIALIGPQTFAGAAKFPATGPGGFITVNAPYSVTPLQGLQNTLSALGSSASVTFNNGTNLASAVALAASSDVAIVMVGDISLEGQDRPNLSLPAIDGVDQDALVFAVAGANPRTIVVLKDGGPVLMPWLNNVLAVAEAWYPGQEDGNAVANLLFGVTNFSGKLPITFPAKDREAASSTVAAVAGCRCQRRAHRDVYGRVADGLSLVRRQQRHAAVSFRPRTVVYDVQDLEARSDAEGVGRHAPAPRAVLRREHRQEVRCGSTAGLSWSSYLDRRAAEASRRLRKGVAQPRRETEDPDFNRPQQH